jgi:phosphate-selective porin OprO and OprP
MKVKLLKVLELSLTVLFLVFAGISGLLAQDQGPASNSEAASPSAVTPTTTPTSSLRDEMKTLEQQNQDLEIRIKALEDKSSGPAFGPTGTTTALSNPTGGQGNQNSGAALSDNPIGRDEANEYIDSEGRYLNFRDPSGRVDFRIGGYTFADFDGYWQPNTDYLLNDYIKQPAPAVPSEQKDFNGFEARKAHLDFGGRFDNIFGMTIGIESDKSTAVSIGIFHAFVYAKLDKALVITAGKFSNILSLEGLQPSADLPFMEASMLSNLVVNKDIGLLVSGELFDHFMDYGVELANGQQDNESSAILPGKADQNGKAITGRLFFTPWEKSGDEWLEGLGFGAAGSYDNETNALNRGSSNPAENLPWSNGLATSLGGNEFAYDGGVGLAEGPFYHLDGQFYYYNGSFGLQGEWVQSTQTVGEPSLPTVALTNQAWLLEGTWVFGGEAGFEGPHIDHPFDMSKGTLGALELVARVDQLTADVKAFAVGFPYDPVGASLSTGAQVATATGIGLNWWLIENFKLMADFERTSFSGGNMSVPPEQVLFARAALIL